MKLRLGLLFLSIALLFSPTLRAQSPSGKSKILVMPLDTMQFYSNVFYLEDLAYFNMIKPDTVIQVYTKAVTKSLRDFVHPEFEYIIPTEQEVANLHRQSTYIELMDEKGEPYFGVAPASEENAQYLLALMDKYGASYFLSLNFYDLYSRFIPSYIYSTTRHRQIIHFDLFDYRLDLVRTGRFERTVGNVLVNRLTPFYQAFANESIAWLQALKEGAARGIPADEILQEKLKEDEQARFGLSNTLGLGFGGGVGAPYGLIGVDLNYHFNEFVDVNMGMGYDFAGFKIGLGTRYYFRGYHGKMKPFVGLGYAYASGSTFRIGQKKDDLGNIINPQEVSKYRLLENHAVHARAGLSILGADFAFQPVLGYAIPFRSERYEVVQHGTAVTDQRTRNRTASFLAVGGLEASIHVIWYFRKK